MKAYSFRFALEQRTLLAVSPITAILESSQLGSILLTMLAHGTMVGNEVDALALLECSPSSAHRATKTARDNVGDVPIQMLLSAVDRVKLDRGVHEELKVRIKVSIALMHYVKQKANGTMSTLRILPGRSVTTSMRRACRFFEWHFLEVDGPLFLAAEVDAKDDVDDALYLGKLGEHSAQHGKTSLKNGASGAEVLALLRNEK